MESVFVGTIEPPIARNHRSTCSVFEHNTKAVAFFRNFGFNTVSNMAYVQ